MFWIGFTRESELKPSRIRVLYHTDEMLSHVMKCACVMMRSCPVTNALPVGVVLACD